MLDLARSKLDDLLLNQQRVFTDVGIFFFFFFCLVVFFTVISEHHCENVRAAFCPCPHAPPFAPSARGERR